MMLKHFISAFFEQLEKIHADNVVLAGSNILELHGLYIGWQPKDLDVVIYNATEEQYDMITDSNTFSACADYMTQSKVESQGGELRAWELKDEASGLKLNIIFEKEPMPKGLMQFDIDGKMWFCQSIKNIIDAKLSYSLGNKKNYMRTKDVHHLSLLKNLNFNPEFQPVKQLEF